MRFGSLPITGCSTPDVLLMGDRFEVVGVNTPQVAAKVINLQTFRNRPNHQLVSKSVCTDKSLTTPKITVTASHLGGSPQPACLSFLNLRPEPNRRITRSASHELIIPELTVVSRA